MKIPAIKGIIRRRLLLNYRVAPDIIQPILPEGFRPKLARGHVSLGLRCQREEPRFRNRDREDQEPPPKQSSPSQEANGLTTS